MQIFDRLLDHARSAAAWTALASLVFATAMAVVLIADGNKESTQDSTFQTRMVRSGDDYLLAADVFWPGFRMTGTWSMRGLEAPDDVRFVAGSDVERMLAGQPPLHDYNAYVETWPSGGVGMVNLEVPWFSCSGPDGGCETGDLPALVFTRGDGWEGQPATALTPAPRGTFGMNLFRHGAGIMPAAIVLAALSTAAVGLCIASLLLWSIDNRRRPAQASPDGVPPRDLEASLHVVRLSQIYLGAVTRSLYVTAGLAIVAVVALELWALPYFADEVLESHFPLRGGEGAEIWIELLVWWLAPFLLGVAARFWWGHLRELRAERRRWQSIAGRLQDLESQVLG